jgi:hypothetical protein
MPKQPYLIVKIYEPEPSSAYSWYIIKRTSRGERVVRKCESRSVARVFCKMYNSPEYQDAEDAGDAS